MVVCVARYHPGTDAQQRGNKFGGRARERNSVHPVDLGMYGPVWARTRSSWIWRAGRRGKRRLPWIATSKIRGLADERSSWRREHLTATIRSDKEGDVTGQGCPLVQTLAVNATCSRSSAAVRAVTIHAMYVSFSAAHDQVSRWFCPGQCGSCCWRYVLSDMNKNSLATRLLARPQDDFRHCKCSVHLKKSWTCKKL